ncbi:formimidoylglutamase [Noviherbaspirillum cavernae]|uniref:Formimidoylglutamase n=1 Tax=Noviherbaspirillum cavernae TaxID=2320862 RepID=A0A418X3H9_9BURK|nr:formimidoylglutamase [Noviherbaspirillum cavernae]RJG06975.1 formimidoylglutamase [Noviherbaspirillum cavernae]
MHQQPDMSRWQGRIDNAEGELGRRWHQIVRPLAATTEGKGIALIGFACDAGVARNHGRIGAKNGPAAIRTVLGNMPVHRCTSIHDAGDIVCVAEEKNDGLESAQNSLSAEIDQLLDRGLLPIALGGGHEIAFGSFGGLARHLAKKEKAPRIGVINLDAHFDLRMAEQASSGTPFRQIAEDCQARGWPFQYCCLGVSNFANTEALFERARKLGVTWRLDDEMGVAQLDPTLATLANFIAQVDYLYFTICLDVLPAAVAPGVSAPAPRGVPMEVIEPIVDMVAASGKLRVADIAELNPHHDIDQRTARVAARFVARLAERTS